jgi:hypothetical protein
MTTTHYYYDSATGKEALESTLQQNCHDLAKKHGAFLRIVKSGAGIVILPDTDRAHDCGPNELAKALHLREEIEKSSTEKTYRDLIIRKEDDNENFFVKLTEEQYRLLTWLYEEELLGAYVEYEKATPFQTI